MHPQTVPIVSILLGALLLLFGRRLFWLFVAAVGFWIGFELTPHILSQPPAWLTFAVAIALGLLGALLALLLQRIAIAVAGFFVGGHIATALLATFVTHQPQSSTVPFLIGGIVGALLLLMLFDWALIFFSAIAGAELIASNLQVPPQGAALIFIALTIVGIVAQAAMFSRRV